ncbi:MAG: hypothetical protein ACO1OT_05385 [Heyndrickxia sp.]
MCLKRFNTWAIFAIILAIACKQPKPCRQYSGEGEGVVNIVHYNTIIHNGRKENVVFNTMTYFIKDKKILRKDTSSSFLKSSNETKERRNGITTSSSLNIELLRPMYLIDLSKNSTFTFYEKDGQKLIAKDHLNDCPNEILYKVKKHPLQSSISTDSSYKEIISGFECYKGLFHTSDIRDSVEFWYTKECLPFRSPINHLVPGFRFNIIKAEVVVTSDSIYLGRAGFELLKVDDVSLPDSIFLLPPERQIKLNVPFKDRLNTRFH